MTNQEVFDTVVALLRKQGAKSMSMDQKSKEFAQCAYRGPNGMKCAVGCLIPDDMYDPKIEGCSANSGTIVFILNKLGIDQQLASELQTIHDIKNVSNWEMEFMALADRHGLKFSFPGESNEQSK